MRYDGRWRNREPGPGQHNMPYVVRLKAPQSGETVAALTTHDGELYIRILLTRGIGDLSYNPSATYLQAVVAKAVEYGFVNH